MGCYGLRHMFGFFACFLLNVVNVVDCSINVNITNTNLTKVDIINVTTDEQSFSSKNAFEEGSYLATLYHSNKCLNSRRKPMLLAKLQSLVDVAGNPKLLESEHMVLENPRYLFKNLSIYSESKDKRAIYVRNQKVASTTITTCSKLYAGVPGQSKRIRYGWAETKTDGAMGECRRNDIYFTFIRDPIEAFISGWLEVLFRAKTVPKTFHPKHKNAGSSLSMPPSDSTALFRAFLEDIERNRFLGTEAFHIWPQVINVHYCL